MPAALLFGTVTIQSGQSQPSLSSFKVSKSLRAFRSYCTEAA